MVTVIVEQSEVVVPAWVQDVESFRRWMETDEFPQHGRVWWLQHEVWADTTKEQIFEHVLVKTEVTTALWAFVKAKKLGLYLTDGVLLSNFAAEISGNPDGLFLSNDTRESDRIRFIEGQNHGFVELQGSPDMVLEIVSDSSVKKDYEVLKRAYWEADITEYWMIDARKDPLHFNILKRSARGYTSVRKREGWAKSTVFGKSFRLTKEIDSSNQPTYTLEIR